MRFFESHEKALGDYLQLSNKLWEHTKSNQTKANIILSLMESELSLFKENDPLLLQVVASSSGVLKS